MPKITVQALVSEHTTVQIFDRISNFARYPELVESVRSVDVEAPQPDGSVPSEWQVYFRNGILHWREVDWFDREALSIRFEQTDGEFDVFQGEWRLEETGEDGRVRLTFAAEFDFGVDSLASIINPVAVRVLTESIEQIVSGLFGANAVEFAARDRQPWVAAG